MMLEIRKNKTWINTSRIWKVSVAGSVAGAAGIEFVVIDYGRGREAWFGLGTEEGRAILRWLEGQDNQTTNTTEGGQYDRRKNSK